MRFKQIIALNIDRSRLNEESWNRINTFSDNPVVLIQKDNPNLNAVLQNADCLLVLFDGADKSIIDSMPHLKYMGALATGVGKIDLAYAKSKGITVTNVPGYATESVAELVFAVLLEYFREISRAKNESKEGNRSEFGFTGREIKNKNFGVIGAGNIGSRVAEIALGFGANVQYWTKNRKPELEKKGVVYNELEEVLKISDIISMNLSLNSETEGIINENLVKQIKENSVIVNLAPHELISMGALEERIKRNELTYIFDHSDLEDINENDLRRLQSYDNCISYPVLGYISSEATISKQDIFIENIKNFLSGLPQNVVS